MFWSLFIVYPLLIISSIPFGFVRIANALFDREGGRQRAVARFCAGLYFRIARIRFDVKGAHKLRPGVAYVICANHASPLDPIAIIAGIPIRHAFLAQWGPFGFPFLFTRLVSDDSIPTPRHGPFTAAHTLSSVNDRGISLVVFPEGVRSPDGRLGVFREGAAQIAIRAQVPVVPVAVVGSAKICPDGSLLPQSGDLRLVIGDPISTAGLTVRERTNLIAQVRADLAALLEGNAAGSRSRPRPDAPGEIDPASESGKSASAGLG